ncbi:hypothetical protein NB231_11829 [Nitrococcus mobilis Nb-231]|uniref:Uncharacterized protein n=1 Tax=Nitrococcus mobilis Nb-231 TaxID=314278 RepID=A4BPC3_9GAMM|nr:hypothetical protein NB231_11829 [Nitrococcus mobilis Nb-231]
MIKDLPDHNRLFDAGNHLHLAGAVKAGLDINIENALEALRPGHGCAVFGECLRFI